MKSFFLSFIASVSLLLTNVHGVNFNGMVTFGDSLSCTGNACIHAVKPAPICNLFPQGRFTNGDVWIEVLAEKLNLPRPKPSLIGGFNFAYGGATSGWEKSPNLLNVGHQIEDYLNRVKNKADPNSLYIVWVGGNDIKNKVIPRSLIPNLRKHITELAKAGAKVFLIPNYPPLQKTPTAKGVTSLFGMGLELLGKHLEFENMDGFQERVVDFADSVADSGIQNLNKQLKTMLRELERTLQITIYHFDTYHLFHEVTENLSDWGLSENDHLYLYDGFHPSALVHEIVGNEAFNLLNRKKYTSRM
ncbi:MAG: hypothetical protein C5B43_04835 [Verrucomicrobia bacterium]|nr:MAG: hypothetical protein C5B43_04835 [Verrucomicrobiota bacterium]